MRFTFSLLGISFLLSGCSQYSNPNDLTTAAPQERVDIAHALMESVVSKLEDKYRAREISDSEREAYIAKFAEETMVSIVTDQIPPTSYWKYADLLRTTKRWPEAQEAYVQAVKYAKTPDRKVNDTLRLAQTMAKNGKVTEAISTARTVFNAKNEDSAPILPATLYEIVPAGKDKGHNKALASLLADAMKCHMRVVVDMNSDSGRAFVSASRHHLSRAESKVSELQVGG